MIGYAFLPQQTNGFYKPIYSNVLDALNWAKGPFLYRVEIRGKRAKEKGGVVSDSMVVLGRIDSSHVLQHFARGCAYRALQSFSDEHTAPELPGLFQWLHKNRVRPSNWSDLLYWAKTSERLWMNGGHAEASICNAILSHCNDKDVWYHSWLAGAHAQMLLGKSKELPTQEKSLKQSLNRELAFVA